MASTPSQLETDLQSAIRGMVARCAALDSEFGDRIKALEKEKGVSLGAYFVQGLAAGALAPQVVPFALATSIFPSSKGQWTGEHPHTVGLLLTLGLFASATVPLGVAFAPAGLLLGGIRGVYKKTLGQSSAERQLVEQTVSDVSRAFQAVAGIREDFLFERGAPAAQDAQSAALFEEACYCYLLDLLKERNPGMENWAPLEAQTSVQRVLDSFQLPAPPAGTYRVRTVQFLLDFPPIRRALVDGLEDFDDLWALVRERAQPAPRGALCDDKLCLLAALYVLLRYQSWEGSRVQAALP